MGNQIVQTVNNQMPKCCNQVLTDDKKNELRIQTSNSRLFREEAKHKNYNKNQTNTLTLTLPKSPTSPRSPKSFSSTPSISSDIIYSLESSDSSNDEILSNDKINIHKKKVTFIKIAESSTTSADHKLETATIPPTDKKYNNKNNKKLKYKNRQYKSSKVSFKSNPKILLKELSDCEIKLKQSQHEKDVLKRENEALKRKLTEYNLTLNINEINSPKSSTSNKSVGYELLSPSNIVSSPSISLQNNNINCSPSAYSICSPTSTHTHSSDDTNENENEPMIIRPNVNKNCKKKSLSIPNFDDIEVVTDIKCECIDTCPAINGIIYALKWYSTNGNSHENIYAKMKNLNYGKLIVNYYNHIMEFHLSEANKSIVNIQNEYQLITDKINRHVAKCTFKQCNGYRRYLRSKNCTNVHKAQTLQQHQLQMYVNTIDGIHTCFMHLNKSFQFQ